MLVFFSLCLAVFFGTVAGIFRTATPFRGTSCGAPVDSFPEKWQPYVHECSRIVTMQGISWSLCKFSPVLLNLYVFPLLFCKTCFSWPQSRLVLRGTIHFRYLRNVGLHVQDHLETDAGRLLRFFDPHSSIDPTMLSAQHYILETVFLSFFSPVGFSLPGPRFTPSIPHALFCSKLCPLHDKCHVCWSRLIPSKASSPSKERCTMYKGSLFGFKMWGIGRAKCLNLVQ